MSMPGNLSLGGIRVLLVEDDPDLCELLTEALTMYQAQVSVASSINEAIQLIEEQRPAIVLSNIRLIDGSGFELIRRLRNSRIEEVRSIPAIAITGYTTTSEEGRSSAELEAIGFQRFFSKPINTQALVEAIMDLLQ